MYVYYRVAHNPDTTEKGTFTSVTYVRTALFGNETPKSYCQQGLINDFCRHRFGLEVEFVQGVAPCMGWSVHEISKDQFEAAEPMFNKYSTVVRLTVKMSTPPKWDIVMEEKNPKGPPEPTFEELKAEVKSLKAEIKRLMSPEESALP